jgi:hypothetical protein
MPNNEVKLIISGDSRGLDQALNRAGKHIDTFGKRTIATFNKVGRTIQTVGDRMMSPFASIATGGGLPTRRSKSSISTLASSEWPSRRASAQRACWS